MITGTVPPKIVILETPRQITEGVKVIGDHPYMLEGEESRWVHVEADKTWYYGVETGAIELRKGVS